MSRDKSTPNAPVKYTSIPQALMLIWKEEGFLSLYKGNGANVLRIIPTFALKVSVFPRKACMTSFGQRVCLVHI